jgi:hypothetical protein
MYITIRQSSGISEIYFFGCAFFLSFLVVRQKKASVQESFRAELTLKETERKSEMMGE